MGCSPSKGKLFSKPEGPGPQKTALAVVPQAGDDSRPEKEEHPFLKTDEKENEPPLPTEEHPMKETVVSLVASDTTDAQHSGEIKETEVNLMPQEIFNNVTQTVNIKKMEKRKKHRGKRGSSEKQMSSILQVKVDFPPNMVRAHQAAYAFLNPNISKYETLLELLDQAAQTQVSLQPMMSALVLRFEEINQALGEMAEEGELMLKEHGDFMALSSGMMGPAVMQAKPSTAAASLPDLPPDLLQQLLQNSTQKMRLVGGSVQALGDTTLEEAVEYFSSLSKLLAEKLQTKQAVERRLTQVLARVEGAAIRKSNPEDSALHSEDSGIGGENGGEIESLTGSERHCHHRGSAGSGSCGSGINIRCAFDALPSNSSNLVGHNEDDEEEDEEEEDDEEEYKDDECDRPERKRSNSSPPDPSQTFFYMHANYMQAQQPIVKRPLTAAIKPEHSASTRCVNIMTELQKSQWDLDQRMKKMTEIKGYKQLAGPHYNLYRAGLRRHSLSGSAGVQKGPFKANQSPCSLPILAPQPPKHNSVRKLINTFSQGVDGRPGQILANIPPHIRRPRKSGILLFSDTVNGNEGGLVINGNNNNNSWPDSRDDLDIDNLPPPPPEVLMDNSFQSTDGITGNQGRSQEGSVRNLPVIIQNTGVFQRLKASVQNVEVLPNRANVKPSPISILPALPVRQEAFMGGQDSEQQPENDLDPDVEKASCLYQQARKIIHLRNAAESPDKRNIAEIQSRGLSSPQGRMGQRCESNEFCEGEISSSSLPVTAPPVSRVRLPPSCPSVCHRFPSRPVFRPMTTSLPSSSPGSPRKVTHATDNIEEIVPSVSFRDARSVFCLKESPNHLNCISSGSSVLPRPWGEASRGRQPMRRMDSSTRRTQSEQRPSFTSHVEFSKDGNSVSNQAKGSELTTNRPGSPLMTGDDAQLDPSAAVTTA